MVSVLLFFSHGWSRSSVATRNQRPHAVFVRLLFRRRRRSCLTAAVDRLRCYTRVLPAMPPTLAWFATSPTRRWRTTAPDATPLDHPAALRGMLHYNYSVAVARRTKFRLVNRAVAAPRRDPAVDGLLLVLAVWGLSGVFPISARARENSRSRARQGPQLHPDRHRPAALRGRGRRLATAGWRRRPSSAWRRRR